MQSGLKQKDANLKFSLGSFFDCLGNIMKRTDLYACLKPHAEEVRVELGEVLFFQGDPGDCFYYVVSGQLRAFTRSDDNQVQTLGYLFPGDHCGEGALVTGNPHRATVRAVAPSTVLKISHSGFRTLASEHRELRHERCVTCVGRLSKFTGKQNR